MSSTQPPHGPQYEPQRTYVPGPPAPAYAPPPVAPKPPRRGAPWWLAGLLAVLWLGSCMAYAGAGDDTAAAPAPGPTVTETVEVPGASATETVTAKPAAPKSTKPAAPEPAELGEGTYEVGVDVDAGRYKTTVPGDSLNCYWERTKDDSGDFGSIIANDNADPGARVSVTIKRGEFFTSNGCGDWARQ